MKMENSKGNKLAIVIPVKDPPDIDRFIEVNKRFFAKYYVIVIDSGGGEKLEQYADHYVKRNLSLWEARKLGYSYVATEFILNLDVDVEIPSLYPELTDFMRENEIDAMSIFYEDVNHCQGALEFGISLWRTSVLRSLYDFSSETAISPIQKVGTMHYASLNNGWCECTYMWRKLKLSGRKLETVSVRAVHFH
jgi:glycosyltransferase involved in cell wall biosynthesis